MTLRKPKKVLSLIIALTMLLTLLPATLGFAASYDSIEQFVQNVYEVGLGREADEEGFNYWVNQLKNGRPAAEFIGYVLLDSPEFQEKYADISNEEFVTKAYEIVFNREADPAGLKFWKDEMSKGGSQKYVIVGMLYAPPGEFAEFCDGMGIKLGTITVPPEEFPVDELEVEDVSAINLKQVLVDFNMDVEDNDAVADTENYKLEVGDDEFTIADLDVEGNTVTLSIEITEEISNQSEATLTVNEEILDEEEEFEVEFFDITPPRAVSAKVVGSDTVKIYFSEPVRDVEKDDIEINDGDYFIKDVEMFENNTQANVTTYSDFDEDTIDVTIKNTVEDFAGFNLISETFTVEVIDDEDAPEIIGYENATTDEVTLIFNEDIIIDNEDPANFYHTNEKNAALDFEPIDGNKIKLVFAEDSDDDVPLPEGIAYVYVKGDTVVDLWGNVAENTLFIKVEITEDTTPPAVEDVEATQTELKITFTEKVYDGADDEDNYTILDSEGDEVQDIIDDITVEDDVVTLKLNDLGYGTYTVIIEGVEDKSGNKIEKIALEIDVDDDDPPSFPTTENGEEDVILYTLEEDESYKEYKIVVKYPEAMSVDGKYSVIDAENYILEVDEEQYVLDKLGDHFDNVEVSIKATDKNEVVEILIEVDDVDFALDTSDAIIIARVADAAGNYTTALSSDPIIFVDGEVRYVTFTAVATDIDKIKVTFSDDLEDFESSDLIVVATSDIEGVVYNSTDGTISGGTKLPVAKARVTANDEIVLTLNQDNKIGYDAKLGTNDVYVLAVGNKSVNRYDESFNVEGEDRYYLVDDEIAPALAERDGADDISYYSDQVFIKFTEAIEPEALTNYTFKVEDATVIDIGLKEGDPTVVVLTLEGETEVGKEVTQKHPIYDTSDNELSGISSEIARINEEAADAAAKLAAATAAVEEAETSGLQADVDAAQALVDALPGTITDESADDYNADKAALQARLDAVQADIDAVVAAKAALEITYAAGDSADSVTQNLTLPTTQDNVAVTWASSDTNVVTNDGQVTRPTVGSDDATVTLTATLTKGNVTATKDFIITVKANI